MHATDLRIVTEFAALAPSVHNTQPWRFVATADSLEVYADATRSLGYLDPQGRQMYLSCGAVAEFARLAVRSMGRACELIAMPDPDDRSFVARLRIGAESPVTPSEQRRIDAIPRRYTDRGPYSDEPVSTSALTSLRDSITQSGCWLREIQDPERTTTITLLAHAETAETEDSDYQSELAMWRRTGHASDGLPAESYEDWTAASRVSEVPLRDFTGGNRHPRPTDGPPPIVEHDALVLLETERDDPSSWVHAGIALAEVLLTLTDAGLVSQPLGPVLDIAMTRARLRHELGLVGFPQLLLRVGHGAGRPVTGRRAVSEIFTPAGQ